MLHAVDLGVAAHVVGNLFIKCILQNAWGAGTQAKNVAALDEDMNEWRKANQVTSRIQGRLTMERLRSAASKYPKLKAKGAATRHLVGFALLLAR